MSYLTASEIAKKWCVSERSVRNYCAQGRVEGAVLNGKTWQIPEDAKKPERSNKKQQSKTLLDILQEEKTSKYFGGIYHKTQIDLTYNSNHIEGSRLTHEQTRFIFETNTIGVENEVLNVDDVIETVNHFRCIDMIIDNAKANLTEKFIKELHLVLKTGTSDSRKDWFAVGDYKKLPNEVGGLFSYQIGKRRKKFLVFHFGVLLFIFSCLFYSSSNPSKSIARQIFAIFAFSNFSSSFSPCKNTQCSS